MTVDCLMCSRELGVELINKGEEVFKILEWELEVIKRGCSLEQESAADEGCGLLVDRAR